MFYSHEILTSPEHGVATIWLVATLGSKSIARKLNRKTILDVDVPRACDVIINPEAPMALRLQGSLLYGVSRVYNQQCGYTLTDVQAMHDKMRSMLKAIPGGGLDPTAGKARPDQLVLPYDPSFLPEINLPGMGFDLSSFNTNTDISSSQQSSLLWTRSSDLSQSTPPPNGSLRLNISSDDFMNGVGGIGTESDVGSSAQKRGLFDRSYADEEGVLLQADFEFDEDGNIVELSPRQVSAHAPGSHVGEHVSETPVTTNMRAHRKMDTVSLDPQPMVVDEDHVPGIVDTDDKEMPNAHTTRPTHSQLMDEDDIVTNNAADVTMHQRRRASRVMSLDRQIGLRNTDLAQWNNEYLHNMAAASKQKRQNRLPTQAKKNAALWVFGQGIGSVGVGLGTTRIPHPLQRFSGDELYTTLCDETIKKGKKRSHVSAEDSDSDSEGRRVRAREEDEEQVGRGDSVQPLNADNIMQDDVEIGRLGPSPLHDDHPSQMPWNITASIKSSLQGSSVLPAFRGLGSVSDFSSRGLPGSTGSRELAGFGRPWSRLASSSPLAGRGLSFDLAGRDRLSSLSIPGNADDDLDMLGDFDLNFYLRSDDHDADHNETRGESSHNPFLTPRRAATAANRQSPTRLQLLASTLDQESLNFLDFLKTQIEVLNAIDVETTQDDEDFESDNLTKGKNPVRRISDENEIAFSALLPPKKTNHVVATQGLMHILTLATKGILEVHQDEAREEKSDEDYGTRYHYGEIFLRLSGV